MCTFNNWKSLWIKFHVPLHPCRQPLYIYIYARVPRRPPPPYENSWQMITLTMSSKADMLEEVHTQIKIIATCWKRYTHKFVPAFYPQNSQRMWMEQSKGKELPLPSFWVMPPSYFVISFISYKYIQRKLSKILLKKCIVLPFFFFFFFILLSYKAEMRMQIKK